jgi:hypothetical protein
MEEISKITNYIYISNKKSFDDKEDLLNKLGIKSILSLGCPPPVSTIYSTSYLCYPNFLDTPESLILPLLNEINEFISTCIDNNQIILCHCIHGQSRSVSAIISYLMSIHGGQYKLQEAINLIKLKRSCICINPGFLSQLYLLSLHLNDIRDGYTGLADYYFLLETTEEKYNSIRSNNNNNNNNNVNNLNDKLIINKNIKDVSNIYCKNCRNILTNEDYISKYYDYKEFLNDNIDGFWLGYRPLHAGLMEYK